MNGRSDIAERTQNNPVFVVHQYIPLFGDNVTVTFNPEMSWKLCSLLEESDLDPENEQCLIALKGQLRRYFGAAKERKKRNFEQRTQETQE